MYIPAASQQQAPASLDVLVSTRRLALSALAISANVQDMLGHAHYLGTSRAPARLQKPRWSVALPGECTRTADDGTHGNQKADDQGWSYAATFPPETTVFYTYTNSGTEGKWEGLDVPVIRQLRVEAADHGKRLYAPIDTFGNMYMHADPWHTNAAGNALIARAVLETLHKDARVKRYLAHLQAQKG